MGKARDLADLVSAGLIDSSKISDGVGSGLNADLFDGHNSDSFIKYYEQANPPTVAAAGSIWKDTDTSILYMAAVDSGVLSWFEI